MSGSWGARAIGATSRLVYAHGTSGDRTPVAATRDDVLKSSPDLYHGIAVSVPGREWWIYTTPTPDYIAARRTHLSDVRDALGRRPDHGTGDDVRQRAHRAPGRIEEKVIEQTAQLRQVNLDLEREISERMRTEATLRN